MSSITSLSEDAPVQKVAHRPARRTARWQHFLLQNAPFILSIMIFMATMVAYIALYSADLGRLPDSFDWTSLVNTALPLIFVALGQGVVLMTRGIDLSVGGVMSISNGLAAVHMKPTLGSMLTWSAVVLLSGALCGLLNGALVAYARLQPILVTLATLSIFQGVALRVLPEPGGSIPPQYTNFLTNPMRPSGLILVLLAATLWWVFRRSQLGVGIIALGNDESAARANGLAVRRCKVSAYVISGVLASAAGLLMAATRTGGDPTAANVFTLTSIAAVVIGGISFFGGRGNLMGAIFGAFALTLVTNVLFFADIEAQYTPFYQGLFLVIAVLLGGLAGRLARVRSGS